MTAQLTFLFTDLENSTGLWQQAPLAMQGALARHDAITQAAVKNRNGRIVKTTGDGLHAAFDSTVDGVLAAVSMQQAMAREQWPAETGPLKIRIGLHTGESQERAGDYYGSAVNTAARVMDLGHGGQVLLSEVKVLLLRGNTPADISFSDLGPHKMKGLPLAERIYQLNHPDLKHEFPQLRSPSIRKHNLPAEITPLVGREEEIGALCELLVDPRYSLFSIVAPGGTGKSRLAIELGLQLVGEFDNGVYFVELAPVNDSQNIVLAVAEAVGYQFHRNGRSQKQQILDYLANKEMLLIMDNYEHLIDGGVEIVTEMLHSAAHLKIVATSRQRLHLSGETLFTLHGLSLPDKAAASASHSAAVEFFEQSARRARPDFEVTPENLQQIVQICRLVHGMPLGILLAAAWVSVISTAKIAEEIEQGLDILEAEGSELPERQRSVRAVFEQAWGMMAEAEQRVFMKTAVFRGGFTREAGQKVAGAGLRQLQSLVNKALLERSVDQDRLLTHELLRQFAGEKLQLSGDEQQVRNDHSTYYLTYLARQTVKLKAREQLPTLKELEADFENIRGAWENAINDRAYDLINQAMEAVYLLCFLRSRLDDGKSLFEKARQGLKPGLDEGIHPVWLAAEVRFHDTAESQAVLRERLETSLTLARARGDEKEEAYCLGTLATIAHYVDQDPRQAIAHYEACVAIHRRLDERYYLAQTVTKLGEAYQLIGRTELTYQYVNEALDIQRRIGDYIGESESLRALGMTSWQTGNYDAMFDYAAEMYASQLQTGYLVGQAASIIYMGLVRVTNGRFEEGDEQLQMALNLAIEIADFSTQAWCYSVLGFEAGVLGDYKAAGRHLESAQAIITDPFRQTGAGNPFLQLHINFVRFLLAVGQGDFVSACKHLLQPLHLAAMTASQPYMATSLALACFIYDLDGRWEKVAELMGLISKQSDIATGWLIHYALYAELRVRLEQPLGAGQLEAARKRGRDMELLKVTQEVLRYIKAKGAPDIIDECIEGHARGEKSMPGMLIYNAIGCQHRMAIFIYSIGRYIAAIIESLTLST